MHCLPNPGNPDRGRSIDPGSRLRQHRVLPVRAPRFWRRQGDGARRELLLVRQHVHHREDEAALRLRGLGEGKQAQAPRRGQRSEPCRKGGARRGGGARPALSGRPAGRQGAAGAGRGPDRARAAGRGGDGGVPKVLRRVRRARRRADGRHRVFSDAAQPRARRRRGPLAGRARRRVGDAGAARRRRPEVAGQEARLVRQPLAEPRRRRRRASRRRVRCAPSG